MVLGAADGTHFSIGELSGGIQLKFECATGRARSQDSQAVLRVGDDALLGAVIGDAIEVALTFGLIGDSAGLRLKDGTGLKATIPLEKIPNSPGPDPLPLLRAHEGRLAQPDRRRDRRLVSGGHWSVRGSIDRLGTKLKMDNLLGGGPVAGWGLKPPSGAGLAIDAASSRAAASCCSIPIAASTAACSTSS
jgi:hypothetical protein